MVGEADLAWGIIGAGRPVRKCAEIPEAGTGIFFVPIEMCTFLGVFETIIR
jgi:hypothetical protein